MTGRYLAPVSYVVAGLAAVVAGTVACGGDDSPLSPSAVCTYTLAPDAAAFSPDGGTGTVTVTAPASCAWSATASASWVTIASGSSGSGPGSVAYTVAANGATDSRTATVTIAGQTHTVSQQGKSPVCSYELSPTLVDVGIGETSGTFAVSAPEGCSWTASSNASWLSVTGGSPGAGSGTVSFQVAANATTSTRVGQITVADKTFTVRQDVPVQCEYSVAPVDFDPCMPARSVTAMVTAPAGCTWTATPNASWLSVPSGSSGSGSGIVTIAFTDNYDAPRNGIVMVRWPTPTAGQNIRIAQAGCTYAVTRNSFPFAAAGGTGTFDVLQQSLPNTCGGATQDRCIWSAVSDVPWITIAGSMPRSGDNRVTFTVAANTTGAPRVGRITVRDQVIVVNQAQ
jgi:hypothetical protein